MSYGAGELNREIVIQQLTRSKNSINEITETWSNRLTCWAAVYPISGKEALEFDRETASKTARFVIYYDSGVIPSDRIVYNSENWDIINIKEVGFREFLELTAEVSST